MWLSTSTNARNIKKINNATIKQNPFIHLIHLEFRLKESSKEGLGQGWGWGPLAFQSVENRADTCKNSCHCFECIY